MNMKLNEQLKTTLPFVLAVILFFALQLLKGIYENDTITGVSYLLLSATFTYLGFMETKRRFAVSRNYFALLPVYGAGALSGLWLVDAFRLFF